MTEKSRARATCWMLASLFTCVGMAERAQAASPILFDSARISGTMVVASYLQCGVLFTATAQGSAADVVVASTVGIGVGVPPYIDDAEVLSLQFPEEVMGVRYDLRLADDIDMDGMFGETLLSGYDSGGSLLGTANVEGTGPIDVTAALGVGGISRLEIAPQADRILLDTFHFDAEPTTPVGLDLREVGTKIPVTYELCSILISTAPGDDIRINAGLGAGVRGAGANEAVIEPPEYVEIDLPGPSTSVEIWARSGGSPTYEIIGYDAQGNATRASQASTINDWLDVSSLFPVFPEIAAIRVEVQSSFLQLARVRTVPEASAGALGALAAGIVGLLRAGRRRSRR